MTVSKKRYVSGKHTLCALPWTDDGSAIRSFGSAITQDAVNLLRDQAAEMGITQRDLLESFARCLHDPVVRRAILRQLPK